MVDVPDRNKDNTEAKTRTDTTTKKKKKRKHETTGFNTRSDVRVMKQSEDEE